DDQDGKFSFIWDARHFLKVIKGFTIATDDDGPGRRLRDELINRLGAGRCFFVEYPSDCKDLNDVLMRHGRDAVQAILQNAKPCPVPGLYGFEDFPSQGEFETFSTGWPLLDRHMRLFRGELAVLTGIPSHGKSSFILNLLANLAKIHGFRSVIF